MQLFTNSAILAELVTESVAMSVCLSVCAIAKPLLPEGLVQQPIAYLYRIKRVNLKSLSNSAVEAWAWHSARTILCLHLDSTVFLEPCQDWYWPLLPQLIRLLCAASSIIAALCCPMLSRNAEHYISIHCDTLSGPFITGIVAKCLFLVNFYRTWTVFKSRKQSRFWSTFVFVC